MWIFDPPPLGGPQTNNELMVGFFWQRLYAIYGYILPQTPYLEILHTESSSFNIFGTMGALTDVWRLVLTCIITSHVSGRGNIIGPMVVCVCVSLCTLTTDLFYVSARNFTWKSTWTISRSSWSRSYVKGQGHQMRKCDSRAILLIFFWFEWHDKEIWPMVWCRDVMWRHKIVLIGRKDSNMSDEGGAWMLRLFYVGP